MRVRACVRVCVHVCVCVCVFTAPSVAPQNIQIKSVSSSQLDVEWQPPPVETQNGNIQGYKVMIFFLPMYIHTILSVQFTNILGRHKMLKKYIYIYYKDQRFMFTLLVQTAARRHPV